MKVLVLGATGGTGRLIVRDALEKGHSVVAMVRSKASAPDLPGANIIEGEARHEDALMRALIGCDAVVSSLGTGVNPFSEVSVLIEATRALLPAMTRSGVRRLICISALGVGDSRGPYHLRISLRLNHPTRDLSFASEQFGLTPRRDMLWSSLIWALLIERPAVKSMRLPGGESSINTTDRHPAAGKPHGRRGCACITPATGKTPAPGIMFSHDGRIPTGFTGEIRHVQRTLTSGATLSAGHSCELFIDAGQKMEKSGILQYVAQFEGLLVLVKKPETPRRGVSGLPRPRRQPKCATYCKILPFSIS